MVRAEKNNSRGSITVQMTSCLFCLNLEALLLLNGQLLYLFGQIQTSQTGGQPYSDTSPNGEYSLVTVMGLKSLPNLFEQFWILMNVSGFPLDRLHVLDDHQRSHLALWIHHEPQPAAEPPDLEELFQVLLRPCNLN